MREEFVFSAQAPYPAIEVEGTNAVYAIEMLSNIGSANSEMSAISLYFYNSIITKSRYGEIAECFHKMSVVEMHHMNIFGQLACLLGADPRLWSYDGRRPAYWTPGYNKYPRRVKEVLRNAAEGEQAAIRKYREQADWIEDPHIVENLNRIAADEEHHIQILEQLYKEL